MSALHLIAVALWFLTGCASSQGLHPEPLNELLRYEEQRFIGDEPPKTLATSPSVHTRSKLGLYLKPTGFFKREFEWTDGDRDAVLAWAKGLRSDGAASEANFIPQSSLKGNTLTELRESAARYGADLLLIVDGAASVDRYNNYKASLLYWTILGAYLADGTHSDALCLLRSSVWDVKAGTRLFSDDAQGTARQVGPATQVDDRDAVAQACRETLPKLLATVKNRLTHPQTP
jgi:hypothetical protein